MLRPPCVGRGDCRGQSAGDPRNPIPRHHRLQGCFRPSSNCSWRHVGWMCNSAAVTDVWRHTSFFCTNACRCGGVIHHVLTLLAAFSCAGQGGGCRAYQHMHCTSAACFWCGCCCLGLLCCVLYSCSRGCLLLTTTCAVQWSRCPVCMPGVVEQVAETLQCSGAGVAVQ